MKRFGLIGHPVAGSLSPRLFEAAYGGRYPYDLLEGAEFGPSWQRFLDGYDGINITAPFKQDAFRAVDRLSDDARLCGAVNLAVKTPSGIAGYNTDVPGVVLAVREALAALAALPSPLPGSSPSATPGTASSGIPGLTGNLPTATSGSTPAGGVPPLREALVVGCGGAGRAAAVAALRLGCHVTLVNRTPARAATLAAELNAAFSPSPAIGPVSLINPASPVDPDSTARPAAPVEPNPAGGAAGTVCRWVPISELPELRPDLVIYTVPGPLLDGSSANPEGSALAVSQQPNTQHVTNHAVPNPSKEERVRHQASDNDLNINQLQNSGCQTLLPALQNAIVLEANYRTPCLEGCGKVYISGRRWLLYQAVAGYEIFTGESPDADAMFRIFC